MTEKQIEIKSNVLIDRYTLEYKIPYTIMEIVRSVMFTGESTDQADICRQIRAVISQYIPLYPYTMESKGIVGLADDLVYECTPTSGSLYVAKEQGRTIVQDGKVL